MDWLKDRETLTEESQTKQHCWNVLIVDDDEQVHLITRQALRNFYFEDSKIHFFSAYSAQEARDFLVNEDSIALIVLDVVMESDDAGLELARYIREELNNHYSRIILRTGQPGMAPEYAVVKEYDIDAYKSKTELKKADLESVFYTALRSYRDITSLQRQRECLEDVVTSITKINSAQGLPEFASAILEQITQFTGSSQGKLQFEESEAYAVSLSEAKTRVLALSGQEELPTEHLQSLEELRKEVKQAIEWGLKNHKSSYRKPYYIHYMMSQRQNEIILTMKSENPLPGPDRHLLEIFSSNVALAYENLILTEEILETQDLLISLLGGAMESRSRETGNHVRRVGEAAKHLASFLGLGASFQERIRIAAPLHDVGKVSTPDAILFKPGSLTSEEWEIMKDHSMAGHEILKDTQNPIIEMAARLARDHHERWDGLGYPRGIREEDISLEGRIVALVDVFDALISPRTYKDPWPQAKAFEYIEDNRGLHFDPHIVEVFLLNKDIFLEIFEELKDETP